MELCNGLPWYGSPFDFAPTATHKVQSTKRALFHSFFKPCLVEGYRDETKSTFFAYYRPSGDINSLMEGLVLQVDVAHTSGLNKRIDNDSRAIIYNYNSDGLPVLDLLHHGQSGVNYGLTDYKIFQPSGGVYNWVATPSGTVGSLFNNVTIRLEDLCDCQYPLPIGPDPVNSSWSVFVSGIGACSSPGSPGNCLAGECEALNGTYTLPFLSKQRFNGEIAYDDIEAVVGDITIAGFGESPFTRIATFKDTYDYKYMFSSGNFSISLTIEAQPSVAACVSLGDGIFNESNMYYRTLITIQMPRTSYQASKIYYLFNDLIDVENLNSFIDFRNDGSYDVFTSNRCDTADNYFLVRRIDKGIYHSGYYYHRHHIDDRFFYIGTKLGTIPIYQPLGGTLGGFRG